MRSEIEALKQRLYGDNKVKNIKFFPGTSSDSDGEDIAREMNKFFADPQKVDGDLSSD